MKTQQLYSIRHWVNSVAIILQVIGEWHIKHDVFYIEDYHIVEASPGFYAFVNFFSVSNATKAKETFNNVLHLQGAECKVGIDLYVLYTNMSYTLKWLCDTPPHTLP